METASSGAGGVREGDWGYREGAEHGMRVRISNSLLHAWRHVLVFRRRERLERELAEEMELHRLMAQDEFERSGMAPEDAAGLSYRNMGNTTINGEECRDMWSF